MIFNNTCLEILPASYGDCIFLSIKRDDKEYNILIDGGLASTYYNVKDKRKPKGPLKLLLDGLQAEGRCIDLLVVTHIDDDHIGGICKWFEMAFPDNKLVKQVWLNDDMQVDEKTSLDNSVSKAVSVLKKLKEKEVGYKNDIVKGFVQTNDFCTIHVIAPKVDRRNVVAQKIAAPLNNAASVDETQLPDIKELIKQKWTMTELSDENKSSIAFELETWDEVKMLLLGDAEYEVYMDGIRSFYKGINGRREYEVVKLSHHGSKNNFHPDILNIIHSKYYVMSSDGKKFGHPDKEVLAQIVDKTDSCILFNYDSRKRVMFNKQDFIDYPDLENRIGII